MADWKVTGLCVAIFLTFGIIMSSGCATGPATNQLVVTEYMLQNAGFKKIDLNEKTRNWNALVNNIPPKTIVTYKVGDQVYHVYGDGNAKTLYLGDNDAYQKYLEMSHGQAVCQRVEGTNTQQFWSCFDDYQSKRGIQGQ
jgi:hypothetical protein